MILLNGVVFTVLWEWFIAPVFSLPLLTLGQAIGLTLVASFILLRTSKEDERNFNEVVVLAIAHNIFKAGWFLALGWVVKTLLL